MRPFPRVGEVWRWQGAHAFKDDDHNVVLEIVRSDPVDKRCDPSGPFRGFVYALILELNTGNVVKSWSIAKQDSIGSWERII